MTRERNLLLGGAALLLVGACMTSTSGTSSGVVAGPAPAIDLSTTAPNPDPRVGLKPGKVDSATRRMTEYAAEASWNLRLLSNTPPSEKFVGVTNSDLAFTGYYAIQGNYNGYQVWNISNPRRPTLASYAHCPASQSDVSVFGKILFVSAEAASARLDCGTQGVQDTVSRERIRGIRIFDATDIRNPKYIGNVQKLCHERRGEFDSMHYLDPTRVEFVYQLPLAERQAMMDEHIAVGNRFPSVRLHTTYSFGLDDQEFVVAFETDEPADFLDLVMALRETKGSRYTVRDTPIFTCVARSFEHLLTDLGG